MVRGNGMSKILVIVSGITGSGKTTYCDIIKHPVLHIDHCFNYTTKTMDYDKIEKWKDENIQHGVLLLDAYLFGIDPDLSRLKETILPIEDISIKIIYVTIEELYKCQRSTPKRIATKNAENLSREEDVNILKLVQKDLINVFTGLLEKNMISSVEYIFRQGTQYRITNKEHFLKILGSG